MANQTLAQIPSELEAVILGNVGILVAYQISAKDAQQAADLWQATTNYDKAQAEYEEALSGATADEISDARSRSAQRS